MSTHDTTVTGVEGGTVKQSIVAGIVHGGMSHNPTTNRNQGSRSITNQGNIDNIARGENQSGAMSASVGDPTCGTRDPKKLTPAELLNLLKEYHCTDNTLEKFEKQKVTGRLFMELDDKLLHELGIDSKIERKKLQHLKEDLCM